MGRPRHVAADDADGGAVADRRGVVRPVAAWATGIGLGAVTVAASVLAGLLGPPAITVCAAVPGLPVWIAALWLARRG